MHEAREHIPSRADTHALLDAQAGARGKIDIEAPAKARKSASPSLSHTITGVHVTSMIRESRRAIEGDHDIVLLISLDVDGHVLTLRRRDVSGLRCPDTPDLPLDGAMDVELSQRALPDANAQGFTLKERITSDTDTSDFAIHGANSGQRERRHLTRKVPEHEKQEGQ